MSIHALASYGETVPAAGLRPCEHRTVSKDGAIVCTKITCGPTEVSPQVCRNCPARAVNCAHLCFSLRQVVRSPLTVRYNGRVETWDDDAPELNFQQAACAARVAAIDHPLQCAACTLRQPVCGPIRQAAQAAPLAARAGKVVAFPSRQVAAGGD
jgi:hypothetical protein